VIAEKTFVFTVTNSVQLAGENFKRLVVRVHRT
jgi:hypothetical protein